MKLVTDFTDYYDEAFKEVEKDITFNRMLSSNMSRYECLQSLKALGYETIRLMAVGSVLTERDIVVYTNTKAHNGEGKQILSLDSAKMMYINRQCSICYKHEKTLKLIQIGNKSFKMIIKNNGLVEDTIEICEEIPFFNKILAGRFPMFSMDFVVDDNNRLLACDFDNTVKLGHIKGIEKFLPAEKIANLLAERLV